MSLMILYKMKEVTAPILQMKSSGRAVS